MSQILDLVFATANPIKLRLAREAVAHLPVHITGISTGIPEIQSTDPTEVAAEKAKKAFALLGRPVIAEDSGLEIEELAGFPGALVKPILEQMKAEGFCRFADLTQSRRCRTTNTIVYINAVGRLGTFTSSEEGWRITRTVTDRKGNATALGELALVLIPKGFTVPLAQLNLEHLESMYSSWLAESCYTAFAQQVRAEIDAASEKGWGVK
ncbi:non-canonical purine NTP pyrophosphatase [Streptomyces sp. NPDC052013]|uniref:non-canonical purine NTP pyrophosphatase n=1 Tax=Streptomyces sp. NPDC052013 TaxID=3365679 RepID=UPI0037D6B370